MDYTINKYSMMDNDYYYSQFNEKSQERLIDEHLVKQRKDIEKYTYNY